LSLLERKENESKEREIPINMEEKTKKEKPTKEWGEVKKILTSPTYPVLWVGEDGVNVSRLANIIKISYVRDGEEKDINTILNVASLEATFYPVEEEIYIYAGGVPITIGRLKSLIFNLKRSQYIDSSIKESRYKLLIASGIKNLTTAVLIEEVDIQWKEVNPGKLQNVYLKAYPYTLLISNMEGKFKLLEVNK
jgi:hypothetical protein